MTLGLLAGASGLKKKTYWICQNCGKKFRDIDELSAETLVYEKRAKGFKIFGLIMCALMALAIILCFIADIEIMSLLFLVLSLPFIFTIKVSGSQFRNCQKELNEIMEEMRKFK